MLAFRIGNFLLPILILVSLMRVSLELDDVNSYLINCGSSKNRSIGNRVFLADEFNSNTLSTPYDVTIETGSKSISSSYDAALYQTARVFTVISNYSFPITKHGRYWIRLYIFPFLDGNYDLTNAKFSVSALGFSLLRDFQPQNISLVKEYNLHINTDKLILSFIPSSNSFAFLNALEILFIPDEVIPSGAQTVNLENNFRAFSNEALETVARVNMGNLAVSRQNDTLWREWVSDTSFLNNVKVVKFVLNTKAVNFSSSLATKEIAPSLVYGTATKLDSMLDPNTKANITWSYSVDPGFEYLVRFHFCDLVSNSPQQLFFNVYIGSWLVVQNLDLSNKTMNALGTPYYMDFVTSSMDRARLSISIGPSNVGDPYPDGILNGLEIMKLSNFGKSLVYTNSGNKTRKTNWFFIGIGLAVGVILISVLLALILYLVLIKNRRRSSVGHSTEEPAVVIEAAIVSSSKIGYRFPFAAIKEATNHFSESNVIGVGGFGKVYKGLLRDGKKIAAKRGISDNQQGFAEFRTEIEMLSQFQHRHLVSLIGYCHEKNEMIIIYECMENGSLKNHLYGSNHPSLSWRKRLEICIGSARGIHYLHTSSSKAIIHRDVKSANILLDENYLAKVADFGISKTGPEIDETHVSTAVKGSFGYLDPEYLTRKQLTEKSDVYSFGVVMLEVLCGRAVIDPSLAKEAVNLIDWVMNLEKRGELEKAIDPFLKTKINTDSLQKFAETVVKCLAQRGVDRPTAGDVLYDLEYALQLQRNDERVIAEVNNMSAFETRSVTSTQMSMGSMDGLAAGSLSRVFSEIVKAENKCTNY